MKDPKFTQLYEMAKKELLEDILPFWMEHDVDEENGGFYGVVDRQGNPVAGGPKCLVLNARLVWTFASAYRIFKEEKYLVLAKRAYDYFCEHFLDKQYGGAYFMLDAKGNPIDDTKFVYGQAFAIYALSEYCRATGDTAARDKAVAIMELLEKHAYDAEHPGYVEKLTRDWVYDRAMQVSNINPDAASTKTMNTHLHMIEAYTCLLRVLPTEAQKAKVREHLNIMLDKVYDGDIHHFKMFFRDDWTPTATDISYGHDIEGTWLMMETAEVLGEKDMLEKAEPRCIDMAAACLEQAILPDGSMIYEYDPVTRHINTNRSWWVQAETVVGFLNAWQLSGQQRFLDASLECFKYIDTFLVDHEYGEWFTMLGNNGEVLPNQHSKIDDWKCPYHNARMCFEIIERYEKA